MNNYTTMRRSQKIHVCPNCQRKGKYREVIYDYNGIRHTWKEYTHVGVIVMGTFEQGERCIVNHTKEPIAA